METILVVTSVTLPDTSASAPPSNLPIKQPVYGRCGPGESDRLLLVLRHKLSAARVAVAGLKPATSQ